LKSQRRRLLLVPAIATALLAVVASSAQASHRAPAAKEPAAKPVSAAAWRAIVAKAKQEGSLTVYTIQSPVTVAAAAAKFKELYGISVTVNRNVDAVLLPQINAEEKTGNAIADVWVTTSKGIVLGALKNKWVADAVGPNLFKKRFDRSKWTLGKAFIQGLSTLGIAWNTQAVPQGVKDIPDFLSPTFADGKLGVIDPSISVSAVAFYDWLQKTYGASILQKLAAQKPKIYTSSLPMTQAVESGEIVGGTFTVGTALDDRESKGAPIDFKLWARDNYVAANSIALIKGAPNELAARLYMNWLLTPRGAAAVAKNISAYSPLPGAPPPPGLPSLKDIDALPPIPATKLKAAQDQALAVARQAFGR
jgi:iron(III) transport system substrate-binding protein